MGLDIVEFVMAAEDEFDLTFDNVEFSRIRTVGEFHELVLKELRRKRPVEGTGTADPKTPCLSSRAFYSLRKALIASGVAGRKDVAPQASLESLIPRAGRRAVWDEVAHSMRCTLPRLQRSNTLCTALLIGGTLMVIAPLAFGSIQSRTGAAWWVALTSAGLSVLLLKASAPRALEFPSDCRSVDGLVQWLTTNQRRAVSDSRRVWTDREVWETISRLIVETQGVEPEQVTPEATFVEDLGMD
jgi:acyl carrier protein